MVQSPHDLLVLQGLRLKGFADVAPLADSLGLGSAVVEGCLQTMAASDLTRFRDGARRGWSLTAKGRLLNDEMVAEELDHAGLRAEIEGRYRDFLHLNREMLRLCTRWQIKDLDAQVLNDHTDEDYDAQVVDDLVQIDAEIQPICADLGGWFQRLGSYGPKLRAALAQLRSGDKDWFTKPTIDSYHTVWFELHEDLLVTLGIDRASEKV